MRIPILAAALAAIAVAPNVYACDPTTVEPDDTIDLGGVATFYVHEGHLYQETNGIKGFQWCDPRLDRLCCGPEDALIL